MENTNDTTPPQTAGALGSVLAAFEFDDHPKGARTIEIRVDDKGSFNVVLCGKHETQLFGADVDQWGTWYSINNIVHVAQEWGTRSFLGALIAALETLRGTAEAETLPPTRLETPNH